MPDCARRVAAAAAGAAGLLLAGCTLPDGVDGDLVNAWDAMPDPAGFTPDAGVCHPQDYLEQTTLADYQPVSCDLPHRTETVHIGEFTGEAAERVTPPTPGSTQWQDAFQQCEEGAAGYLGADFRNGRLWLGVTVPSVEAWEGGARWVRCDVSELDESEENAVDREESLANALLDSSDLTYGCSDTISGDAEGSVEDVLPVPCDEPHNTEFVGVVHVSEDVEYPFSQDVWDDEIHPDCTDVAAEFADTSSGDVPGTLAVPMSQQDWDYGDRGVRCHIWLPEGEVSESFEGAGTFPDVGG